MVPVDTLEAPPSIDVVLGKRGAVLCVHLASYSMRLVRAVIHLAC